MSHIKTELLEQSVPLYSVRFIEGLRLFDLIQENSAEPKSVLTAGNLESSFKKFCFPDPHLKSLKIMHQVAREGQEMTNERFAAGLANCLKHVELTNEQSLAEYYNKLKELFFFTYQKPLQRYEQWDIIDSSMTPQALNDRQNNIDSFYSELHSFIEGMQLFTFQSYLEKLNYCLSVISISSLESKVFKVYKTFINPTVMNHISDFLATIGQLEANPQQVDSQLLQNILSQKQNMVGYFALISHFYSACKYRQLKERLETTPCLFYQETYKTILMAIKIPEVKIQQQVAICLCMMSKHIETFNQWVLSDMQNHLMPLLASVSLIKDEETSYFTLICLKNIMRRYQKSSDFFKSNQKNLEMLERIQRLSFFELGLYINYDIQKECFLLIAQILKVCPVKYKQIEELKLTTKVFELIQEDYQAALIPAALAILEVSIHRKLDEITNMMINDPGFLDCLQNNFGVKNSTFFYHFLHIVYLLSYTHTNFLFEKNLLGKLLEMMFEGDNPTVFSIGSDILLNAVQQALQNEQILEILYDKLKIIEQIMPFLFKKCFTKSELLNLLLTQNQSIPQYNYFDKYILNNFFKILYSLAVGVNRKHKKYAFLKRVDETIINSISNILDDMFRSDNRKLIELVLREKVKISSKKLKLQNGIPLFKLITILLQEMTHIPESRPLSILKTINRQVKSFGQNLLKSQAFTLHELEVQNIPVYIKVIIQYDNQNFVREIPHKFEFGSLKAYVKTLVSKGTDCKLNEVKEVKLKYNANGKVIENEVHYRILVNKQLENRNTEFEWIVDHVTFRSRREDVILSSFVLPNYQQNYQQNTRSSREPNLYATSRSPTNFSRQQPNFGGSRVNQTMRENVGDNYGSRSLSPFNSPYGDRSRSPGFGEGNGIYRNR